MSVNLADSTVATASAPAFEASGATLGSESRSVAALPSSPAVRPASVGPIRRFWRLNKGALRAAALAIFSLAVFLFAWHVLASNRMTLYVRFVNIPPPGIVLDKARAALATPVFVEHILISCRRIALGFCIATFIAVPLGLVMGRFRLLRETVLPVTELLRPIPAIAWVPMSIMLWPTNEESIVYITFLGSFFPILLNTLHGMKSVDPVFVRAARCLGAKEATIFREVYFPAALPHIFTGLVVGMGVAWVSLIAAEMISGQFGVGYFTWEAYSLIQYADIVLGMVTIGLLGLLSSLALRGIGRVLMPWSAGK
ncbi:MAG: ABC transporter permease [Azospirillum sp.]|nr:ABC transporter permease [Azospirillum sp.]